MRRLIAKLLSAAVSMRHGLKVEPEQQDPGPRDPGSREPPPSLKVGPGTLPKV